MQQGGAQGYPELGPWLVGQKDGYFCMVLPIRVLQLPGQRLQQPPSPPSWPRSRARQTRSRPAGGPSPCSGWLQPSES